MGRIYSIPYSGTLTAAGGDADLCSIQPADDKPCQIIGFDLGQTSELGDAAEENIRLTVRHLAATVTIGSGGSAVTPVGERPGTSLAAGFTARCNDTTVATTTGANTIATEGAWNERNTPFEKWIPENQRKTAVQGEALVLRNESTVADDISINLTVWVEEFG